METYIEKLKNTLYELIHETSANYWLYTADPKRDFSRDRKLSFVRMVAILVSMGGGSLRNELIDHFHCSANMASASAFVQRRAQLLPEALEYLFRQFTEATGMERLYKGYRLLAADGSDLQIAADPKDKDTYFPGTNGQTPYSMIHINAIYEKQRNRNRECCLKGAEYEDNRNCY